MSVSTIERVTIPDVDSYLSPDVWVNPSRMGGEPCFAGTRVPVRALFDHLRAGDGYGEFLEGYEGVTREQVIAVLDLAARSLFGVESNSFR